MGKCSRQKFEKSGGQQVGATTTNEPASFRSARDGAVVKKNGSYLASRLTGHSGLEGGQSGRRFMVPPSNKNLRREKNKNKKDHPNSQTCADFFDENWRGLQPYSTFLVKSVQIDRFLQKPCYAIHRY